ncbi:hypothetical protein [Streptomyces sp. NPDC059906]|uniref:hypothetical protein n=1 Tax=Streptomyces sp. NPDC059906 TaxID=3346997 RepID=UPI003666B90B
MADVLYPLAPDEDLPELATEGGMGTMLLRNSRADESGLLSIRAITSYEFVGRSRVRWSEAARTYLFWWILMPAAFVVPNVAAALAWEDENSGLYGLLLSVGAASLMFALLFLYTKYWRSVRDVRWAEAASGRSDGRRWQEFASDLQMGFFMALFGLLLGFVIFMTAMVKGELPTNSEPDPNPYAHTLLHPATLLVGLPVATGVITVLVLARRGRR